MRENNKTKQKENKSKHALRVLQPHARVRNETTQGPYFCAPLHRTPIADGRRYRLHHALHATGPDLLCNTTVRALSLVAPPRSPPRAPPALDRGCMITTKKTRQYSQLELTGYSVWLSVLSGAHVEHNITTAR